MPFDMAETIKLERSSMVSSDDSVVFNNSMRTVSKVDSEKSPFFNRSTCSSTILSAFFFDARRLGTMSEPKALASLKSTGRAMAANSFCSFINESSMPALPFDSRRKAMSRAGLSGCCMVTPFHTSASALMMGMGNRIL